MYSQQDNLVSKAKELIYSNPEEAIKISEHILKSSQLSQEKAMANLLISKSYMVKGNYNKAIIHAFDEINQVEEIDLDTRIENYLIKSALLRILYIDKQSQEYLNQATILTLKATENKVKFQSLIVLEQINMLLDRRNTKDAIILINEAKLQFKSFLENNNDEKKAIYLAKERAFKELNQYDSAFVYINKTLSLIKTAQVNNLYEKAIIYKELGHLYLQTKEFKQSEETLFIALRFGEILNNPFFLEQINRDLAINYLATNQKNKHKVYNDEFLVLNNKVEQIEQESVNTVYNLISHLEEKIIQTKEKTFYNYLYLSLAVALLIFTIGVFILLKDEGRKKRLREIINYLEISRSNFIKIKPSIKISSKRISIPEETEQALLLKLKKFEKSEKFLNNDMSLAVLSGQFETNTKYLSEIINNHYNDNFNTFINKLRIKYIIEKLKTDKNYINYKISFLAEECGFATHSSFATIFKSIVGMTPATFINLIKEDREKNKPKNTIS